LKYRAELQKRPGLDGFDLSRTRTFGPSAITMHVAHEDGPDSQFAGLEDPVRRRRSVRDKRRLTKPDAIELQSRRICHRERDAGLILFEISLGGAGRTLYDDKPEVFKLQAGLNVFKIAGKRQQLALGARQQPDDLFRVHTAHRR